MRLSRADIISVPVVGALAILAALVPVFPQSTC